MIYLDYAAATPLDPQVEQAMRAYGQDAFYNPSALYAPARKLREENDALRARAASLIGAKPAEVYFTAGATESINLAIGGVMRRHPDKEMAVSAIEHSAVEASAEGYSSHIREVEVDANGLVDPALIKASVSDETVLISIGYANSEIGVVQPMAHIAKAVAEIRSERQARGLRQPLYLHSDASAAAEYLHLNVHDLGVDLLSLSAAKIYGPKRAGVLYVRHGVELEPLIYGGGQERGLRSGTEDIASNAGLIRALEVAQAGCKQRTKQQRRLQQELFRHICGYPDTQINGSRKQRIAGNINASFSDVNGEELVHYLDARNILVATGAACDANRGRPSKALQAIGCREDMIDGSLRVSLGRDTSREDIEGFMQALGEIIPKLRGRR